MSCFRSFLFASMLSLSALSAAHAANVDVVFFDNRFGVLNDQTGAYTQIGTLPLSTSSGIAAMNGYLYLEDTGMNLLSVDPISGASHTIGATGLNTTAAVFAGGTSGLFEIDYSSNLYSIDPATGKAKLIGATGLAANNGTYDTSLSASSDALYYTAGKPGAADELYRINITTGVAMDLGSTGVTGIAGSANVNGKVELYQYGQNANYLYSATDGSLAFARGAQLSAQIIDGGAVLPSSASGDSGTHLTPEPASFGLIGLGLFLYGFVGRRKTTRVKSGNHENSK